MFLDEPTTGLDLQAKRNLWDLVQGLNEGGMTIVLTTHNMEEAEELCDRIAIMDHGKIIAEGTPEALILVHPSRLKPRCGNLEDVFLSLTGHGEGVTDDPQSPPATSDVGLFKNFPERSALNLFQPVLSGHIHDRLQSGE